MIYGRGAAAAAAARIAAEHTEEVLGTLHRCSRMPVKGAVIAAHARGGFVQGAPWGVPSRCFDPVSHATDRLPSAPSATSPEKTLSKPRLPAVRISQKQQAAPIFLSPPIFGVPS